MLRNFYMDNHYRKQWFDAAFCFVLLFSSDRKSNGVGNALIVSTSRNKPDVVKVFTDSSGHLGQPHEVAESSGIVAIWLIPLHFSFAFQFPLQRFLQCQLKTGVIAWVSLLGLVVNVVLSWLLVYVWDFGLIDAAIALDVSWWVLGSNIYVKNIDDSVSDEELKSQFVQINKENRKQLPYQITGMVKPSKLLTCFQWGALMVAGLCRPIEELDNLPTEEKALLNSLQTGNRLIAAGYVLYSSATILCITFGSGTHAFTLDRSTGDFILTNPNIKIPPRGQIYSVNDARYFDWPEGLRKYIDTVRQGKGRYPKKYSARYICSLVADLHRTLLYGGVAMNPRDHLRLVYEANPLSFIVEQAGGTGSDWKSRILSLQPVKLHQRLPLFLGSLEDMEELESYGDVQQKVNPGYEV
ncbi:hypothetical protein RYX36_013837 [Vicia faba]